MSILPLTVDPERLKELPPQLAGRVLTYGFKSAARTTVEARRYVKKKLETLDLSKPAQIVTINNQKYDLQTLLFLVGSAHKGLFWNWGIYSFINTGMLLYPLKRG